MTVKSNAELCNINDLIFPLILKGQSPYHIKQTLGNRLPVSEATIRRLIDKGELPAFHFQLAFKMPYHTSQCVVEVFDRLENTLGTELFSSLFGVILTDNGHEFGNLTAMETSVNGGQRTKVFYCEPNRSDEKGSCENNHRMFFLHLLYLENTISQVKRNT